MFGLLDIIKMAGAAFAGACLSVTWAVFVYGPDQYEAGGIQKAAELDAATNKAIGELRNEADRRDFLFEQCRLRGGVYEFFAGKCVEGETE